MLIRFEMSGGYGGLFAAEPLSCVIDIDDLGEVEAAQLSELVHEGELDEADAALGSGDIGSAKSLAARDTMNYRLQVTDGGRTVEHRFDDVTMPAVVRPLVEQLRGIALRERRM